jgi:hypothetical protein
MPTTSIAIPLKGREKPVDLPKEYKKVLENELHVRYLESIGAAPSKANMSVIRRHLPPDKCKFHTAWKSRGWVSDTLYITLEDPAQSAKVLAMRKAAAAAADLSAIDKLPASLLQGDVSGGEEEEEDDEPDLEVAVSAPSGAMSFADAQRSRRTRRRRSKALAQEGDGERARQTGSPPAPSAAAPANTAPATAAAAAPPAADAGPLSFSVQKPTWVEVIDAAGVVVLRRTLNPGEEISAAGKMPLRVTVGDIGGLQAKVRGQPKDLRPLAQNNVARFEVN